MYLVGYVCGPMAWGPLSESYGRKGVMMYAFSILTIFSVASALAPNFAALVIFRLFVGIGGSAAISVVGGICADIYNNPISRGRSMALFMVSRAYGYPKDLLTLTRRQLQLLDPSLAHLSLASYPCYPGAGLSG